MVHHQVYYSMHSNIKTTITHSPSYLDMNLNEMYDPVTVSEPFPTCHDELNVMFFEFLQRNQLWMLCSHSSSLDCVEMR